jgi:hypothetical protein
MAKKNHKTLWIIGIVVLVVIGFIYFKNVRSNTNEVIFSCDSIRDSNTVCPEIYTPVCVLGDALRGTYSNSCELCSFGGLGQVTYKNGECDKVNYNINHIYVHQCQQDNDDSCTQSLCESSGGTWMNAIGGDNPNIAYAMPANCRCDTYNSNIWWVPNVGCKTCPGDEHTGGKC